MVRIYEGLAAAFAAEGTDRIYTLSGTGNMHWVAAMQDRSDVTVYHTRHEHSACSMAMGYHSATGRVGVASVTCGPGFTQIMTALTSASRNRVPLVVLAGEAPIGVPWHEQRIEQQPLAAACGAHYISAHSPRMMHHYVREAFHVARLERRPVVIGVPYDLQTQPMPDLGDYAVSDTLFPATEPLPPHPDQVEAVARELAQARCPVVLAGRGAVRAGARDDLEALADACGGLLATTLMGRGMFDHHPFSIGVAGGYGRAIAREAGRQADLVVAFGASLTSYTLDGGKMFPSARVVQVDTEPVGLRHGRRAADTYLHADARLAAKAILERVRAAGRNSAGVRSDELARRIREEPADPTPYGIEDGTLDPRDVFSALERVIPGDYDVIHGSGHYSYFHSPMRGGDPARYHAMRAFGAIGSALSYATGVATVRGDGRVVLFEGDGGLTMFMQEFETIRRHGIKLLIVCANDGAYGSEVHKLRADGVNDASAIFGRADLEPVARGFGLNGATVTDVGQFESLMADYERGQDAAVWNVLVSDRVINPHMRAAWVDNRKG